MLYRSEKVLRIKHMTIRSSSDILSPTSQTQIRINSHSAKASNYSKGKKVVGSQYFGNFTIKQLKS